MLGSDKSNTKQLTKISDESTRQNVPDRPIPALQWMTAGPTPTSRLPVSRTFDRKERNAVGDVGTPKSGHVVYWKCSISRLSPVCYSKTHININEDKKDDIIK